MKAQARYAEIYNDIVCGKTEDSGDGILRIAKTLTTKSNLEPNETDYISECKNSDTQENFTIPKGNYYLIQDFVLGEDAVLFSDVPAVGVANALTGTKPVEQIIEAAKTLWLEFIWQDAEPADDIIYVRIFLHEGEVEDKKTGEVKSAGLVFQLLRRIKN